MAIFNLPPGSSLKDAQFVEVQGPDGLTSGFVYDQNTKTFYAKESQVIIPSSHGQTHIAEDRIPDATQCAPGLLSSDDKTKLDLLLQTRVGVLGYQGSGFPDDGGWMSGDIVFQAGSEFISLERFGNTIRFTADSPIPLSCPCEECAEIFWIQDETDTSSIRPPSCAGKLPGVNAYGEMKIFLMPESTIVDSANPAPVLNTKNSRPALVFKRHDDSVGNGEFELILERFTGDATKVGWAMTPGALGVPECVWFMGSDDDGNSIRFELSAKSEPGLLGALLYKGHTLTRQMATITAYDPAVLSTNCYVVKQWDISGQEVVGEEFVATNIWAYDNPENTFTDVTNPKARRLDATIDLLDIGTLVQLWSFEIGETNGVKLYKHYFNLKPTFNPANAFVFSGGIKFGELLETRDEVTGPGATELTASQMQVSDLRLIERSIWGITGFDQALLLDDDGLNASASGTTGEAVLTGEPSGEVINNEFVADIDPSLPGLRVYETDPDNPRAERPINIWHRMNHKNLYAKMLIGRPDASVYPPVDILLGAPIDSLDDTYLKVLKRGVFASGPFEGLNYITVKGANWKDIPPRGTVRVMTNLYRNKLWKYNDKIAFSTWDDDAVTLVGFNEMLPFDDDFGLDSGSELVDVPSLTTVVQILHEDYTAPALRLEFSINQTPGEEVAQVQFKVGNLDMSTVYELEDEVTPQTVGDNLVRGLEPGYTVSQAYTQVGFIDSSGEVVESTPDDFVLYDGGYAIGSGGETVELWNELELLYKDGQLYIWWNKLLVPPSGDDSALLETPVQVTTPYFPIDSKLGKLGLRLWPGSKVRSVEIYNQTIGFSEFSYGQLQIGSSGSSGSGSGSA